MHPLDNRVLILHDGPMSREMDKLIKDFEEATADVAKLESELKEAIDRRNQSRQRLRVALEGKNSPVEENGTTQVSEIPFSLMAARKAIEDLGKVNINAKQLAGALGVEEASARNRLQRGTKLGLFERVGRGLYKLTEKGFDLRHPIYKR